MKIVNKKKELSFLKINNLIIKIMVNYSFKINFIQKISDESSKLTV